MAERSYVPFDVFSMQVDVAVSTLVRDGNLGWTCGQCPLDRDARVLSPGDLIAQAAHVCDMIETVLNRGNFDGRDIGKLNIYFIEPNPGDGAAMVRVFQNRFAHQPVLVPIRVPHFYYDGMMIEVDVFAGIAPTQQPSQAPEGFDLQIVDCADLIWVAATVGPDGVDTPSDGLETIASVLDHHGLTPSHLLSDHWFASGGDDAMRALRNSDFVTMPDAAVQTTGEPTPFLQAELAFSREIVNRADYSDASNGVSVVSKRSGDYVWTVASCDDPRRTLVEQTRPIMEGIQESLTATDMTFKNVTKLTTHYVGGASADDLHDNLVIRHGFHDKPGPASTGLPVHGLFGHGCKLAIDAYGVASESW